MLNVANWTELLCAERGHTNWAELLGAELLLLAGHHDSGGLHGAGTSRHLTHLRLLLLLHLHLLLAGRAFNIRLQPDRTCPALMNASV